MSRKQKLSSPAPICMSKFLTLQNLFHFLSAALVFSISIEVFSQEKFQLQPAPEPYSLLTQIFVNVDGQMKPFLFDTGNETTKLKLDGQTTLYQGGLQKTFYSAGASEVCDIKSAPKLSLGAYTRENMMVVTCNDQNEYHAINNLGIDFFEFKVLTIDGPAQQISISDDANKNFQPLRRNGRFIKGALILSATIGDVPVDGLFDTGATASAVDAQFVRTHLALFEKADMPDAIGRGANGEPIAIQFYILKSLTIGAKHFENLLVTVNAMPVLHQYMGPNLNLVIGVDVINQAIWTFDLLANRWAVE